MKVLLTGALAASLFVGSANAAIVTLTTGTLGAAMVAADGSTLLASGSGFVAAGFFTGIADGDIPTSSAGDIAAAFAQYSPSTGTITDISGFAGQLNFVADDGLTPVGSAFVGQNVYGVIGNGADIASSTELAIYKMVDQWGVEPGPLPTEFTISLPGLPPGGWVMGGATGGDYDFGPIQRPAFQLEAVVPEPTAAALGLLGFLGLLRRRR